MNSVTLIGLGLAFGYSAFQRAGVLPNDWAPTLAAIGAIALLHFVLPKRAKMPRLDRIAGLAALAVLLVVALELVPLPVALVRTISPARYELLNAASPILGPSKWVALSTAPYETARYLLTITGYLLVFLVVRDLTLAAKRSAWIVVWPLLLIGALEAIFGVLQAFDERAINGMATGTYQNHDHYAGLLEMVLPFAVVYAVAVLQRDEHRFTSPTSPVLKACLLLTIAAITLVAVVLSLSRMGFFSALAALLVAGIMLLSVGGGNRELRARPPWWRRWLPIAAVVALTAVCFIFLPTDLLIARFSDVAKDDSESRLAIWRDTVGLVKAYPLFGSGMGTYESSFLRYKSVAPMLTMTNAHNDYLQVLAELGIFGFAAGLIFIGRLVQGVVRSAIYGRSVDQRCLSIACLAAMIAILLHSVADFNMYIPANGFAFAWIAGIAGAQLHLRRPVESR